MILPSHSWVPLRKNNNNNNNNKLEKIHALSMFRTIYYSQDLNVHQQMNG